MRVNGQGGSPPHLRPSHRPRGPGDDTAHHRGGCWRARHGARVVGSRRAAGLPRSGAWQGGAGSPAFRGTRRSSARRGRAGSTRRGAPGAVRRAGQPGAPAAGQRRPGSPRHWRGRDRQGRSHPRPDRRRHRHRAPGVRHRAWRAPGRGARRADRHPRQGRDQLADAARQRRRPGHRLAAGPGAHRRRSDAGCRTGRPRRPVQAWSRSRRRTRHRCPGRPGRRPPCGPAQPTPGSSRTPRRRRPGRSRSCRSPGPGRGRSRGQRPDIEFWHGTGGHRSPSCSTGPGPTAARRVGGIVAVRW